MKKCVNKKCMNYEKTDVYLNNCGETHDVEDCPKAIMRKVTKKDIKIHGGDEK